MPANRRQHYVPQSYLRAWSPNGTHVWTYDTYRDAHALLPTRDVAQERYFNDAFRRRPHAADDGFPADAIERQFQEWENDFLLARDVALGVAQGTREGTLLERRQMSICIALQLLRTAQLRDILLQQAAQPRSGEAGDLIGWLPADLRAEIARNPAFATEHISLVQACLLWESMIVPEVAAELYHYLWVVAVNRTPWPFYTTDAPVAALAHPHAQPPFHPKAHSFGTGAMRHDVLKRLYIPEPEKGGLELIFPVAPECALLMFHPCDFAETLGEKQGKVLALGGESAQLRNVVIAGSARRQVFSCSDDFQLARAAKRYNDQRSPS
ncbi:DUF4238 domain-containing protein [Roseisolibacter sp. H3M3-2]|uniref:DUF4238 domain-containing protein n=1 Tax=Roseisolibacter sp. H3M3-2 TaxID=3031323 RepID=UPI0023DCDD63|nr:DUF4238 domain-containing protein [Roseisolibacter sp. H3M3-2]MDF1502685.1 DUF4238 domain-containing protein [Roseisolibacter sp. H3M3-2]